MQGEYYSHYASTNTGYFTWDDGRIAINNQNGTPVPQSDIFLAKATATTNRYSTQYTDVSVLNTFYPYVQCLSCKSIMSGYACGGPNEPCSCYNNAYFRPGNTVSRGEMAKFVSSAAGYGDVIPPDRQTFTDVPHSNTYWVYIERLYLHGVVQGYNTSSPCTTGTPCYLPDNNSTRGQTAKVVSIAANYQDVIPPNQQTFTDVPPNTTYWLYVERAYLHGVVQGYNTSPPCTTGTPCYLPENNVTRGQTSKFLSVAFFPNCTPYNCFPGSNDAPTHNGKGVPGLPGTPTESTPTPTSSTPTPSSTREVPSPIPTGPIPVPTGPQPTVRVP